MAHLVFTLLDEAGFALLRTWFSDLELRRRFEYPTRLWFDYVCNEPNVHAWLIQDGDLTVGQLQLDIEAGQMGYIGFYVNPELRNQGYGKRILDAFLARPEANQLGKIVATAEVDNAASHRCLQAAGFIQYGNEPDEEGFLSFIYAYTTIKTMSQKA
jgi:RimJ/RimL family protein N-acetyltransferase